MNINYRKYLFYSIGTIFSLGTISEVKAQEMTFSEAYSIMNRENSGLKAVSKQEEVHQFEVKARQGLRYPSVKAFGLGIYTDLSLGLDFNNLRNALGNLIHLPNPGVLGDWSTSFNKRDMAMGGFMATWPLYTGGKINAAIAASKIEQKIGVAEFDNAKNKLVSELVERYYLVKLAEESVKVHQQVQNGMLGHLNDAIKLEEQGMIAPVERLAADVAVSEANRKLIGATKDANLARVALANTLEVDEVKDALVSDFFIVPSLEPLQYYQDLAITNYPVLQKLALQKELAVEGVKVKQAGYYPTVLGFGQTILAHNNPISGLGVLYDNNKPWVVGVGISYNLFEGFKTRNEVRAAKATKESVELFETKAHADIKMLIEKLYKDIEKQHEQINSLSVQEKLAEEFLRVRNRAFSEGFATSTEVTDAEMNLSGVKLMKLQAHFAYAVDIAALLEYTGLSTDFLKYTK